MKLILPSATLWIGLFANGTIAAEEPGRAGKPDILLSCGFDDDDWWRAWGSEKPPENTSLVTGQDAFGGAGKSLRVRVARGDHMGTTFAYRFRERLGAEPEEIYGVLASEKTDIRFRDVETLKIEEIWVNVYHGGETPVPKQAGS